MRMRPHLLLAATVLLAVVLGAGASPRPASADVEVDVTVFYGSLAPHGDWVQVQPYGWAWVPDEVDYGWRPYTVGWWAWVEPYGWTWISEEPWGWATYHYGRWLYVEAYGWVWFPGTVWAPAWVVFRFGDPWVGWAPLPPEPGWRYDAAPDPTVLNVSVSIGTHAWSFVPLRSFAEPDLGSRIVVSAYNEYLLPRTQWSTRYAAVPGGLANRSIDVATVERARRAPVPRRRLQEAPGPEKGGRARVEGEAVVLYKPRVAAKPPANPPGPRPRAERAPGPDLDAWTAQRRAALKAHLDGQRKAIDDPNGLAVGHGDATPGGPPEDAATRREAHVNALEAERKRLEALLEQQRRRREAQSQPPSGPPQGPPPGPPQGPPPGHGGDGHGKGGGHGKDHPPGMK